MSKDIVFLPDDDKGIPGEMREVGGEKYLVAMFFAPGMAITLPDGRKIRMMQVFIDYCLGKLYLCKKARDN